jgi:hypothetical protein
MGEQPPQRTQRAEWARIQGGSWILRERAPLLATSRESKPSFSASPTSAWMRPTDAWMSAAGGCGGLDERGRGLFGGSTRCSEHKDNLPEDQTSCNSIFLSDLISKQKRMLEYFNSRKKKKYNCFLCLARP